MAGPPKTKVSKRKLDNTMLAKNPKASKQDFKSGASELEPLKLELNLMKDKYEVLVTENKEKISKINVLQK